MTSPTTRPQTQLYLSLPASIPSGFEAALEQVLQAGRVSTVMMLASAIKGDEKLGQRLCNMSQSSGAAFLIGVDEATLSAGQSYLKRWHADGLHLLNSMMPLKKIRNDIGADVILGSFCGLSRHAAMLAGEDGADYVAAGYDVDREAKKEEKCSGHEFDHILVFLGWYLEMIELPIVAWDCCRLDDAKALAAKGADFLAVNEMVWDSGLEAKDSMSQLQSLVEQGSA